MVDSSSGASGHGPSFHISHDAEPGDVLITAFSTFGLAGLTAVDFLVEQLDLRETGHVSVEQLPAITPFENGVPRHHTRFFTRPDGDFTVLANELFVPTPAADPFAKAIFEFVSESDVDEIVVLAGIPVPHGPDDHRTFYVATEDFRERRLETADVPPMGTGFLDGVNAELMARGIDDDEMRVGVFVTPVHAQAPDVEAAIRLLDTVAPLYGIDVDTEPLEAFAQTVAQYYAELAERVEAVEEGQRPEDRMYM